MNEIRWIIGQSVRVVKPESTYYKERGQVTHVNEPSFPRDRYYTVLLNTGKSIKIKGSSLDVPSIKVFYLKHKLKSLYEDIQYGSI